MHILVTTPTVTRREIRPKTDTHTPIIISGSWFDREIFCNGAAVVSVVVDGVVVSVIGAGGVVVVDGFDVSVIGSGRGWSLKIKQKKNQKKPQICFT